MLLRGANDYMLDEMDRSLHDAFCIVKRVLESGQVVPGACRSQSVLCWAGGTGGGGCARCVPCVPVFSHPTCSPISFAGGGAVAAALSVYLEQYATTLDSREQLAIAEFADALLIIPKTLAVNAAKDATDLVAKLRAYHYTAQTKPGKELLAHVGMGGVGDGGRDWVVGWEGEGGDGSTLGNTEQLPLDTRPCHPSPPLAPRRAAACRAGWTCWPAASATTSRRGCWSRRSPSSKSCSLPPRRPSPSCASTTSSGWSRSKRRAARSTDTAGDTTDDCAGRKARLSVWAAATPPPVMASPSCSFAPPSER